MINFLAIINNVRITTFMQHADVFERFKFVGIIQEFTGERNLKAATFLKKMRSVNQVPEYEVVGIIVPGKDAAFCEGYKVISDGHQFATIVDYCGVHGIPEDKIKWLE